LFVKSSQLADIHISAHPNAEKALKGLVGDDISGLDFFSLPIELGPEGVKDVHSLGKISDSEQELMKACVAELKGNIER
jgi:malate dehydrogenase